jgi:hypothetical protein
MLTLSSCHVCYRAARDHALTFQASLGRMTGLFREYRLAIIPAYIGEHHEKLASFEFSEKKVFRCLLNFKFKFKIMAGCYTINAINILP